MPSFYVNPRVGNAFVLVAFTIVVLGGMELDPRRAARRAVHRRRREPLGLVFRRQPGPARHFRHLHRRPSRPPDRPLRSQGVTARDLLPIVAVVAIIALAPLFTSSNTVLNFLTFALIVALAAQGWNILGGFGGQFSFGHAAFFGTGAYATAILQMRFGVNAWVGFRARPRGRSLDRRRHRLSELPLRAARLLLRPRDAGFCGSVPNCRERRRDDGRRRRHADPPRREAFEFPVRQPRRVLLDRACARRR